MKISDEEYEAIVIRDILKFQKEEIEKLGLFLKTQNCDKSVLDECENILNQILKFATLIEEKNSPKLKNLEFQIQQIKQDFDLNEKFVHSCYEFDDMNETDEYPPYMPIECDIRPGEALWPEYSFV